MKKLSIFALSMVLIFSLIVLTPDTIEAHHGGSNWVTDNTYYGCVGYTLYKYEQQHRHVRNADGYLVIEYRTVSTNMGPIC